MRQLLHGVALVTALASLAGCEFWFGGDDCDDPYGYADEAYPFPGYRDPYSGQCIGGGGGGGGGGGCYGGYEGDLAAPEPNYDYALCESECEWLDEAACIETSACRAIYIDSCYEGWDCDASIPYYYGCWGTAPSGPVQGGDCTTFDAYECSRHDDCSAVHYTYYDDYDGSGSGDAFQAPTVGNFEYCIPEDGSTPGESCSGDVYCDALPPECPAGTVPGIENGCWTWDCVPFADCDPPIDPGSCWEQAVCLALGPDCGPDAVAGVRDGCWTGYCIPLEQCEAAPTCEDITDPQTCNDSGCTAIWQGDNCTCPDGTNPGGDPNASDCTCETWTFVSCSGLD